MNGECEFGICEICGKEKPLQRTYYRYNLKCECHNSSHSELVRHCKDCLPVEPRETRVTLLTEKLKRQEYDEDYTVIQSMILKDIVKERQRQDSIWGEQNHRIEFWTGILGEEFGELCEAINETVFDNGPEKREKGGYENMKKEAIHVAAVAIGFLECLERNKETWGL